MPSQAEHDDLSSYYVINKSIKPDLIQRLNKGKCKMNLSFRGTAYPDFSGRNLFVDLTQRFFTAFRMTNVINKNLQKINVMRYSQSQKQLNGMA
jgi:hypothetical protein